MYNFNHLPQETSTISLTDYYESQNPINVPIKNIANKIKIINQIYSFSDLKENWDSYGASVISKELIHEAIKYVRKLDKRNIDIYYTVPSPQGDIMLELKNKDKSIEIEFLSDKNKVFSTYESNNLVKSGELNNDSENEILEWINI